MVACYRVHQNCEAVGQKFGLSRMAVRAVLVRLGVKLRNKKNSIPKGRDERIVRLYESGLSALKIGPMVGLAQLSVYDVLIRMGVKRRPPNSYVGHPEWYLKRQKQVKAVAHLYGTPRYPTAAALARRVGLPQQAVRIHLLELGVWKSTQKWKHRLTPEVVRQIKADLVAETRTFAEIAERHSASPVQVNAIAHGRCWIDVPWPAGTRYRPRGRGFWGSSVGFHQRDEDVLADGVRRGRGKAIKRGGRL